MLYKVTALILFLLSLTYFFIRGADLNLILIPLIAAISYFFMIKDKRNLEKYRNVEWTITSPLILYGLLQSNKTPLTTTLIMILLSLLMIGTAIIGESNDTNFWFFIRCLLLIPIIYYLYHLKNNKPAIYLTIFLWSLYPMVWILQKDNLITLKDSNISFSILDVIAQIGIVDLLL